MITLLFILIDVLKQFEIIFFFLDIFYANFGTIFLNGNVSVQADYACRSITNLYFINLMCFVLFYISFNDMIAI